MEFESDPSIATLASIKGIPPLNLITLISPFQSAEKRQTPTPTEHSVAGAPNYLRHPVVGYKVDVSDIPEEDAAGGGVIVNHAGNHDAFGGRRKAMPSFRILKVKIRRARLK